MEHIVQFGVSIDDDMIQKHVAQKASEAIIHDIRCELGVNSKYMTDSRIRTLVKEESDKFFEEYKDTIIQGAVDKLADKLLRTKKVREETEKVLNMTLREV